jgi:hypothetical protein
MVGVFNRSFAGLFGYPLDVYAVLVSARQEKGFKAALLLVAA